MSRARQTALTIAAVLIAVAPFSGLSSCGKPTHRVMSFLFDGVPPLDDTAADSTLSVAGSRRATRQANYLAVLDSLRAARALTVHEPYAERDCESCHNMLAGGTELASTGSMPSLDRGGEGASWLVLPVDELCFDCHDDLSASYAEENDLNIHSPVEDGECVTCHNPHRSKYAHLLRAEQDRTLCFECHDETIPEGDYGHPVLKDEDACIGCHNPHLSSEEFLLEEGHDSRQD